MTDTATTTEPASPEDDDAIIPRNWWQRYQLLSVVTVLVAPVIFLVFLAIVGGLTPDARCGLCGDDAKLAALPGDLKGDERSYANVDRWVNFVSEQLPQLHRQKLVFEWERPDDADPPRRSTLQVAADELSARYAYAIPVTVLILISVPIAIAVLILVWGKGPRWRDFGVIGAVIVVIAISQFQDLHPVRLLTAEFLLGKAALQPYPFLTPQTWELTFVVVEISVACVYAAVWLLVVLMAWTAWSGANRTKATLRAGIALRARMFKLALTLGSLVMIFGVAATHGLFQWPVALMAPESKDVVSSLASSAALYWGVFYSLMLIGVTAPAAVAIYLDIRRLGAATEETPADIAQSAGFTFDWSQSLGTLATVAGPVLTAPVLELLKGLG